MGAGETQLLFTITAALMALLAWLGRFGITSVLASIAKDITEIKVEMSSVKHEIKEDMSKVKDSISEAEKKLAVLEYRVDRLERRAPDA